MGAMSSDKTIRRVTDPHEQQLGSFRYWQSRTCAERMDAVEEIVRSAFLAKGIDLDQRPSERTMVRIERPAWKAI
jgi:hypothetical protein